MFDVITLVYPGIAILPPIMLGYEALYSPWFAVILALHYEVAEHFYDASIESDCFIIVFSCSVGRGGVQ